MSLRRDFAAAAGTVAVAGIGIAAAADERGVEKVPQGRLQFAPEAKQIQTSSLTRLRQTRVPKSVKDPLPQITGWNGHGSRRLP